MGLVVLGGMASAFVPLEGLEQYQEVTQRRGDGAAKIALIKIQGVITSDSLDGSSRGMVERVRDQFALAARDTNVKAVLLHVDSPGGEVMASDEIHRAVQEYRTKTGRPVICSMAGMAASGGYYIAVPCQYIVAHEISITGSIGVIMQTVNVHGLMERVGVRSYTITSGEHKDMLSMFKSPDKIAADGDEKLLRELVDQFYARFKRLVAEGRSQANEFNRGQKDPGRPLDAKWTELADGRILTGQQAYEHGFVDKLGNLDVAIKEAERLGGITGRATVVRYSAPFDLSSLFRLFVKTPDRRLAVDIGLQLPRLEPGRPYFLSPLIYK